MSRQEEAKKRVEEKRKAREEAGQDIETGIKGVLGRVVSRVAVMNDPEIVSRLGLAIRIGIRAGINNTVPVSDPERERLSHDEMCLAEAINSYVHAVTGK